MAQLNKLTYEDKTNPVAVVDRPTQATAADFNDIKEIVNACVDGVNYIKSDEANLIAGDNTVTFIAPYALGVPYSVIVHNCYDTNGYLVAHRISNKTKDGFDVNVGKDCTIVYLTAPQR